MIKNTILVLFFVSFGLTTQTKAQPDNPKLEQLNELCRDPASPFKYDKQMNEYSISITKTINGKTTTANYPIAFCPFTGTSLPDDRDKLFFEIDQSLLDKVLVRLSKAKTLNDVRAILGKPDEDHPADSDHQVPRTFTYTSLSKTTDIRIQENGSGGSIMVIGSGKEKPATK